MRTISSRVYTQFRYREYYDLDQSPFVRENISYLVAGLVIYIGVLIVRSWANFSQPGLYAEDSIHYFNFYYGNLRSFSDIFQIPNGYYNVFNNLIAWLVAKMDILIQPFLYQLISTTFVVLTISAFFFSGLIRNRCILLVGPLVLGLSGMNHVYYYISLTFQMYTVVLLLLVLLLWQRSRSVRGHILHFSVASFLIWSGPYSVLAVPFCLTFIVLFRGKTLLCAGIILVCVAYTLSVSESTIMFENLLDRNIMGMWGKVLVTKMFLMGFKEEVNLEKLALMFGSISFLLIIFRKERYYLKVALLLAVIMLSSMAPLFLSKKYLLYQTIFPCHLLIVQFFWIVFILFSLDQFLNRVAVGKAVVNYCLGILVVAFIYFDNTVHQDKYKVPVMENIPPFLHAVKDAEKADLLKNGQRKVFITDGTSVFHAVAVVGDRSPMATLLEEVHVE